VPSAFTGGARHLRAADDDRGWKTIAEMDDRFFERVVARRSRPDLRHDITTTIARL